MPPGGCGRPLAYHLRPEIKDAAGMVALLYNFVNLALPFAMIQVRGSRVIAWNLGGQLLDICFNEVDAFMLLNNNDALTSL